MDAQEKNGIHSENLWKKLQIQAIMSVPPLKVTEPRRRRKVLVTHDHQSKTIQGCYRIVLYFEKLEEENSQSWCLAGWIVESLARILLEYPLLAGRIQTGDFGEVNGFEIVSNDSGIRLLEACYASSLLEFVELDERENLEAELVFWKDIDPQNPEFSPLFYVQVTNFECGGYSIGISCSLLLADILISENFLEKWTKLHINMLSQNEEFHKTPIFYHPCLKNLEPLPNDIITPTQSKNRIESTIFKITTKDSHFFKESSYRELATLCVEKIHKKMGSHDFFVVMNESPDVIKVESCLKSIENNVRELEILNEISSSTLNEFGVYEVEFHKGNKAFRISCWIGSIVEKYVMAIPLVCTKDNACAVILVSHPLFS